jgi:hypothetical protein
MAKFLILLFISPLFADTITSSGDKGVDEALGLRGVGPSAAGRAAISLLIYANIVAEGKTELPVGFWDLVKSFSAVDGDTAWKAFDENLYRLDPIDGVFDLDPPDDCVKLKMVAISKKPANPHREPEMQSFDVVLWLPWKSKLICLPKMMSEIATFSGLAELKRQGAYPVPDSNGKPLDAELMKVTEAKMKAEFEAEKKGLPIPSTGNASPPAGDQAPVKGLVWLKFLLGLASIFLLALLGKKWRSAGRK